jgi:ubiquinol-cytochrome c reductase cytochrome c1 subunit
MLVKNRSTVKHPIIPEHPFVIQVADTGIQKKNKWILASRARVTSGYFLLKQWLVKGLNVFAIFCMLFLSGPISAEEFTSSPNKKVDWSFDGITGSFDRESIQRGYKVYKEVCTACHSMNRVAFRNLQGIGFSEEDVKQIAASYQVKDGPNDLGEMFDRPGIPSDYFIAPFDSKEAAAASNNGAVPPDLSLIIKARHDGANYVYSLLTGYQNDEQDENGLYLNPYFPTGKLAMAPPLSEGMVEYDGTRQATVENMAYDVVNFLQWAAEPELEHRHKLGFKVVAYFVILTVFFVLTNNKIWSKLYKKKR